MVAAVAFESVVKLVAFSPWVCSSRSCSTPASAISSVASRPIPSGAPPRSARRDGRSYATWPWLLVLSVLAILCLPRQCQVAVVENVDERHVGTASWLFPLYLFAINLFVLPIAFGGLLSFPGDGVDADTYVLALPLAEGRLLLALLVFLGGLSAATGMVIVETVALSTMVSNSLVLPVLLRTRVLGGRGDLSRLLLGSGGSRSSDRSCSGMPTSALAGRGARAGLHRAHLVRRGGSVRAGAAGRSLLARASPRGCGRRPRRGVRWSGPTPCPCRRWPGRVVSASGFVERRSVGHRPPPPLALFGLAGLEARSRTACSGACWPTWCSRRRVAVRRPVGARTQPGVLFVDMAPAAGREAGSGAARPGRSTTRAAARPLPRGGAGRAACRGVRGRGGRAGSRRCRRCRDRAVRGTAARRRHWGASARARSRRWRRRKGSGSTKSWPSSTRRRR